jgi:predicted PurR-regulated permease PerM
VRNEEFTQQALEAAIKIGVVALLVIWCFEIVKPFIIPILWGIIIAVAIFPMYRRLRSLVGQRAGIAATIMTAALLLLMVGPVVLLVSILADNIQVLSQELRDGSLMIPPPPPGVKTWPIVGVPIEKFWSLAADNLSAAIQQLTPLLKEIAKPLLSAAAAVGFSMVEFLLAAVLAGVFLAYSEEGHRTSRAIGRRLAGQQGVELVDLSEATMRSVARGVLGVAAIQAFMAGLGLVIVGVPFAGLWTVVGLILAILQIGVGVVMIPAVFYVFSTSDTVPAVLFLIWAIFTVTIDNFLKPVLLGRGLDVPMAVIFMGAIGGMLMSGIIGLFVGAILLAMGYKVFLAWLDIQGTSTHEASRQEKPAP